MLQISGSENERGGDVLKYEIEISTGDRLGAGTLADIYLSLHGDKEETDEIYLTNPVSADKKYKPFKRGQVCFFIFFGLFSQFFLFILLFCCIEDFI